MAIAGGIVLLIDPFYHISFSQAEVLSDEGKSYVFDERAKGIVLGEGSGLVLLKPYEKAFEDGDQILAVILGSAVNNDGHTMGLTVPSLEGQKEVIHHAIKASIINPDSISYLEAHGTGTSLGDPIEIKAATQVYREYTQDSQYCAVGSVKSNMGHLLLAAGIASFVKVVLALQNRLIPATLHCEKPHPRFKFESSPFYPVTKAQEWIPRQGVRRAGISSFGFGGTNCHLILEEFSHLKNADYIRKKEALPMRHFNKRRYWLGKEIVNKSEPENGFDRDFYLNLLNNLQQGNIDLEKGLDLLKSHDKHSLAPGVKNAQ
jgi:acyl transferase domain-containing protein